MRLHSVGFFARDGKLSAYIRAGAWTLGAAFFCGWGTLYPTRKPFKTDG